jgi:sigma-B regulation protein RsbU (phosphoserine phosphatase)
MSVPSSRLILLSVFLLDLLLALAALANLRTRKHSRLTAGVGTYLLLAAFWALCTALELKAAPPTAQQVWAALTLLPYGFLPWLWLFLVFLSAEQTFRPPSLLLLLLVEPLLLNALAWTDSFRPLIWRTAAPPASFARAALAALPGPGINLHAGFAFLVVLAGALILFSRRRQAAPRRTAGRRGFLLAAGLLPWLCDAAVRLNLGPETVYPTPVVGGVSALLLYAVLLPLPLSDLMPFAYETIVNSMRDPVIVLDMKNRIITHNAAAAALLPPARDSTPGSGTDAPLAMLNARVTEGGELIIEQGGEAHAFDMGLSPLLDKKKKRQGKIMVLRDISERQEMERELRSLNARIKLDLERAANLQASLLPHAFRQVPGVRFDWIFEPCDELAGDLFNIFRLDERHAGFYLLDVSGHGLVASLLSFALGRLLSPLPDQSSLLKRYDSGPGGKTLTRPVEVAETLNRQFPFNAETQQYFSLFYGIYNFEARLLRYVSAGHSGFAYLPSGGAAALRAVPSFPIGLHPKPAYREQRLQVLPGDRVYLFSDGITELLDSRGVQFGTARLLEELTRSAGTPLRQSLDSLLHAVRHWGSGTQRSDDISILAFEAGPGRPASS